MKKQLLKDVTHVPTQGDGVFRIYLGGNWIREAKYRRLTSRRANPAIARSLLFGFRIARNK